MPSLAEDNSRRGGRPVNVYRATPAEFTRFWGAASKLTKPTIDEPGFGSVGYATNRNGLHLYRMTLVPCGVSGRFFWVRLETPKNEVDFAFPAPLDRVHLPQLMELWEMEEALWVEGSIASASFPATWRIPGAFTQSATRFLVMGQNLEHRYTYLTARAGIHTMRAGGGELAGVVGDLADLNALGPYFVTPPGAKPVPFPRFETRLTEQQMEKLRELGSNYAARLLITGKSEGAAFPYIPHFEQLQLNAMAVSRFAP